METRKMAVLCIVLLSIVSLQLGCGGDGGTSGPENPACQVSPTSLTFGSVVVGGSADLTFTIQNTGGGTLSGTVSEACDEFSIVGATSYSLTSGQSATFTVRFAPTSAGSKSCTIETGSTICGDVSCTGTGTLGPVCQVTPTTLPFGNVEVGNSADLTFTIENTGGGTLSGTVTESCDDFFIISTPTYSLGAGQSATFTIRFTPTSSGFKSCLVETSGNCASDVSCYGIGYVGTPWYCVDFDGMNDYAFVSSPGYVNILSSVTVEAWMKRAKSGEQLILDKRSTSLNGYALGINTLGYLYFIFSGYKVTSTVWLPFDQWVFVTGQYDSSSDLLQIYMDGVLTGSLYIDILPFYSYGPLYIARDYLGLYFFGGRIDEIAVYNTATRSGPFVPPSHLSSLFARALWPLDEGAGSYLHDWSGWGNDAVLVGGTWVQFIITASSDAARFRQNVLESK